MEVAVWFGLSSAQLLKSGMGIGFGMSRSRACDVDAEGRISAQQPLECGVAWQSQSLTQFERDAFSFCAMQNDTPLRLLPRPSTPPHKSQHTRDVRAHAPLPAGSRVPAAHKSPVSRLEKSLLEHPAPMTSARVLEARHPVVRKLKPRLHVDAADVNGPA